MSDFYSGNINHCRWWAKLTLKKGSSRLYIKLFYHGHYREWSTGLKDDDNNRAKVERLVEAINRDLAAESFIFHEAFPGASEDDKALFAEKEGKIYTAPPAGVTFKQAYASWKKEVYDRIESENTRADYRKAINPHILPFFGEKSFDQITEGLVQDFYSSRFKNKDPDQGLLSGQRMKNINIPLSNIWKFTVKKRKWNLESPFNAINDHINKITGTKQFTLKIDSVKDSDLLEKLVEIEFGKQVTSNRRVILFSEYLRIREQLDPFYRPAADMILLTGLSASEIAGLHKESLRGGFVHIVWSVRNNKIKNRQKNVFRTRKIPQTKAIERTFAASVDQNHPSAIFAFLKKNGKPFGDRPFRDAWENACAAAGIAYVVPYSLRHCFVAYCELMGIDKPRIIGLMGHADKDMINRRYGKYVNGLEKDRKAIKEFYGEDFWGE
jgi:integrase